MGIFFTRKFAKMGTYVLLLETETPLFYWH
jgi:hypothetical protein